MGQLRATVHCTWEAKIKDFLNSTKHRTKLKLFYIRKDSVYFISYRSSHRSLYGSYKTHRNLTREN